MNLNHKKCENAVQADKTYKLSDGGGLYLEVKPSGSKLWRLKYRYANKEKKLCIGTFPLISLAEAREQRENAKKLLGNGLDPSAVKQEQKRQLVAEAENTFENAAWLWFEHNKDVWSDNHASTVKRRLENDVLPILGKMPIRQITAVDLLTVGRKIEERAAYEVARRALQYCGQVFRYAIVQGLAERNPAPDIRGALKSYRKGHYAAFDYRELPEFLAKFRSNDARLFPQTRLALELMMLTFVRTSELIQARWEEFDLDDATWLIPAERMKMRRPHIVPLSKQAIHVLTQMKAYSGNRELVFPSQTNPRKPMSNNTILMALGRMGYRGKMTGHGFRALAMSTIKEKLGYRHEVVDRQLAHAHKNQIDAAYDRAQFLDDRQKMMQEWADYLDSQ